MPFGSFIAGTASIIGLMLLAPVLSMLALKFGAPEIFALMLFGLTMVTYLCMGSITKGLIMAVAGFFVSTIGMDPISGTSRFTLGSLTLVDGVGIVPAAMGMFGVGEVLTNIEQSVKKEIFAGKIQRSFPHGEGLGCLQMADRPGHLDWVLPGNSCRAQGP